MRKASGLWRGGLAVAAAVLGGGWALAWMTTGDIIFTQPTYPPSQVFNFYMLPPQFHGDYETQTSEHHIVVDGVGPQVGFWKWGVHNENDDNSASGAWADPIPYQDLHADLEHVLTAGSQVFPKTGDLCTVTATTWWEQTINGVPQGRQTVLPQGQTWFEVHVVWPGPPPPPPGGGTPQGILGN